jgi:threonine/homoserine/homoserine lactone efflux protein
VINADYRRIIMMLEPSLFYLYLAALGAIYLSPGPDMALVLAVSASQGRKAGLNTTCGIAVARTLHVLGSGLGLAALFATHPNLQGTVRIVGAGYLLFWVWKMLRTPLTEAGVPTTVSTGRSDVLRGFLTNLLNPKALLFCSLLLPQFTSPERGTLLSQFILLGFILVIMGGLFDVIYVFLADGLVQRLGSRMNNGIQFRSHLEKARNWLMIIVLGGMAIRLLIG